MVYNLPKILLKESEQGMMMMVGHILALIQKCSANTLQQQDLYLRTLAS